MATRRRNQDSQGQTNRELKNSNLGVDEEFRVTTPEQNAQALRNAQGIDETTYPKGTTLDPNTFSPENREAFKKANDKSGTQLPTLSDLDNKTTSDGTNYFTFPDGKQIPQGYFVDMQGNPHYNGQPTSNKDGQHFEMLWQPISSAVTDPKTKIPPVDGGKVGSGDWIRPEDTPKQTPTNTFVDPKTGQPLTQDGIDDLTSGTSTTTNTTSNTTTNNFNYTPGTSFQDFYRAMNEDPELTPEQQRKRDRRKLAETALAGIGDVGAAFANYMGAHRGGSSFNMPEDKKTLTGVYQKKWEDWQKDYDARRKNYLEGLYKAKQDDSKAYDDQLDRELKKEKLAEEIEKRKGLEKYRSTMQEIQSKKAEYEQKYKEALAAHYEAKDELDKQKYEQQSQLYKAQAKYYEAQEEYAKARADYQRASIEIDRTKAAAAMKNAEANMKKAKAYANYWYAYTNNPKKYQKLGWMPYQMWVDRGLSNLTDEQYEEYEDELTGNTSLDRPVTGRAAAKGNEQGKSGGSWKEQHGYGSNK